MLITYSMVIRLIEGSRGAEKEHADPIRADGAVEV
jgi:hypothetical protein